VCVCVRARMCVRTRACMCSRARACFRAHVCGCMSVHMHRHAYLLNVAYCQPLHPFIIFTIQFNPIFYIYLSGDKWQRSCFNEGLMYVICVWSEFCVFMNNQYSVCKFLYISKFLHSR
jgi:hypothetical protein